MTLKAFTDTIAAISTPIGVGGVAIVRISGSQACFIATRLTQKTDFSPNKIVFSKFINSNRQIIDEGLVSYFRSPNSYTGEDVIEINCHGGYVIAQAILEQVMVYGARMATKGEFTLRAFINGKLDLLQAEAVIDLIDAKTFQSSQVSVSQLEGQLSLAIKEIRTKLLHLIAHLEVHLDYPEEEDLSPQENYVQNIQNLITEIDAVLNTFNTGRLLKDGVLTIIAGKPNVGKSSLLNSLLRDDRAIVSHIAGTTRDTIEEWMQIDGLPFKLIDTAGIRQSSDDIEIIGINKAKEYLTKAEIVLVLLDASTGLEPDDMSIIKSIQKSKIIFIINKIDILPNNEKEILAFLKEDFSQNIIISTSLMEKESIHGIEDKLVYFVKNVLLTAKEEVCLLNNERQKEQLVSAKDCLEKAQQSVLQGLSEDFWLIDLKQALSNLSEVIGENVSEEILENIFSRFCVGK